MIFKSYSDSNSTINSVVCSILLSENILQIFLISVTPLSVPVNSISKSSEYKLPLLTPNHELDDFFHEFSTVLVQTQLLFYSVFIHISIPDLKHRYKLLFLQSYLEYLILELLSASVSILQIPYHTPLSRNIPLFS